MLHRGMLPSSTTNPAGRWPSTLLPAPVSYVPSGLVVRRSDDLALHARPPAILPFAGPQ